MLNRTYKYILTPELLLYSKNPYIKDLIKINFIANKSKPIKNSEILANYPKDINELTQKLLLELMTDYGKRGFYFENQYNPNWEYDLVCKNAQTQREILDFLINRFGLKKTKYLLRHYTQVPQYIVASPPFLTMSKGSLFVVAKTDNVNLYSFAGRNFYQTYYKNLMLENPANPGKENQITGPGPCESLFELTEQGDKLVCLATDDPLHFDVLMGIIPTDKRWPDLQFSSTGLQFSLPLGFYIESYLHHTFNADNRSDSELAAFFGWPSRGTAYEKVVSVLFFPVMFVKAFAKLFFEAIPALVQAAGDFLLDRCMKILALPKTERTTRTTILAGIGAFVGALLYVGGGIPRFAARCVLSPVDAAKETYSACFRASRWCGFSEKISKGVGIVGAAVSVAVSGAAWTFIAIAALPVLPAVGIYLAAKGTVGKAIATGLSKAGSWIINAFNWFSNPAIAAGTAVSATSTLHAATSAAVDKISAPPSAPAPIPTIAPAAAAPELNGTKNINETLAAAAAAKEAEKTNAAVATQIPEQTKEEIGTNGAKVSSLPEATFAHTEATPTQDLPAPRKSLNIASPP